MKYEFKSFKHGEKLIYDKGGTLEKECFFIAYTNDFDNPECLVSFKDMKTAMVYSKNLSRPSDE